MDGEKVRVSGQPESEERGQKFTLENTATSSEPLGQGRIGDKADDMPEETQKRS
jgi:hypothetical protein